MIQEMIQVRSTAHAHMERDSRAGHEWSCSCEACEGYRSLMGMEKVLNVRPLVRELERLEEELEKLPDGPEKSLMQSQFFDLYDRLAQVMEK